MASAASFSSHAPTRGRAERCPSGVLQSHLFAIVDATHSRRICRVEARAVPPAVALPSFVTRCPERLAFRTHACRTLDQARFNTWSESADAVRAALTPMPDSSLEALQEWNSQLKHARDMFLYWSIDLPMVSMEAGAEIWQLLVFPAATNQSRMARPGRRVSSTPLQNVLVADVTVWLGRREQFLQLRRIPHNMAAVVHAGSSAAVQGGSSSAAGSGVGVAQNAPNAANLQQRALEQLRQSSGTIMYRALDTLSQSHDVWPFGAIAELLDNAVDALASSVSVTLEHANAPREATLSFLDDGTGMTRQTMQSMLSQVGWSSKMSTTAGAKAFRDVLIGKYGQGFKTGFARLGAAVTVLTKFSGTTVKVAAHNAPTDASTNPSTAGPGAAAPVPATASASLSGLVRRPVAPNAVSLAFGKACWTVGFLALPGEDSNPSPFNDDPEWNQPVHTHLLNYIPADEQMQLSTPEEKASWAQIRKRSPIRSLDQLSRQFARIPAGGGTLILISRLRCYGDDLSQLELQVVDQDLQLPQQRDNPLQHREWASARIQMDYSLHAYAAVLYRRPRLRILVQNRDVVTHTVDATLRRIQGAGLYQEGKYELHIGRSDGAENDNIKGAMLYHGNRLISSYQYPDAFDVPYMAVLDTACVTGIEVHNNKQQYIVSTKAFHTLQAWIRAQCAHFKRHVRRLLERGKGVETSVQDSWVFCCDCKKWRRYPMTEEQAVKAHSAWTCSLNTWDSNYNRCGAAEEWWDRGEWTGRDDDDVLADEGDEKEASEKAVQLEEHRMELTPLSQEPRASHIFELQLIPSNQIGSGAFADVFKVLDDTNVLLALKRFRVTQTAEEAKKNRADFLNELANQRLVQHPNVVSVVGWIERPLSLLMQYVNGRDLFQMIHGSAGSAAVEFTPAQKHGILVGTAEGLTAMHREHIVHRDYKPGNIMIEALPMGHTSADAELASAVAAAASAAAAPAPAAAATSRSDSTLVYHASLCDFGVARKVKSANVTRTTSAGGAGFVGSYLHSAPEELRKVFGDGDGDDDNSDNDSDDDGVAGVAHVRKRSAIYKASDVWSFGAVMLELLTGRQLEVLVSKDKSPPLEFGVDTTTLPANTFKLLSTAKQAAIHKLARGHPFFCNPCEPSIKPYLAILQSCLAQDAAQRPSMASVLKQLRLVTFAQLYPSIASKSIGVVYRVLSSGDMRPNLARGLYAKRTQSDYTPEQHVARGGLDSHLLSTTKNLQWALWYWCKLLVQKKLTDKAAPFVVELDLDSMQEGAHASRIITHDMTAFSLANNFRMRFAHSADEVLVESHIPRACITKVYDFGRSFRARQLLEFTKNQCLAMSKSMEVTIQPFAEWLSKVSQRAMFKKDLADGTFERELRQQGLLQVAEWDCQQDASATRDTKRKKQGASGGPITTASVLPPVIGPTAAAAAASAVVAAPRAAAGGPPAPSGSASSPAVRARSGTKRVLTVSSSDDSDSSSSSSGSSSSSDSDSNSSASETTESDAWSGSDDDPKAAKFKKRKSLYLRVKQCYFYVEWRRRTPFASPEFTDAARRFYADLKTDSARENYASTKFSKTRAPRPKKEVAQSALQPAGGSMGSKRTAVAARGGDDDDDNDAMHDD